MADARDQPLLSYDLAPGDQPYLRPAIVSPEVLAATREALQQQERTRLRDQFAAAALTALLVEREGSTYAEICRLAWQVAEQMLEERDRQAQRQQGKPND